MKPKWAYYGGILFWNLVDTWEEEEGYKYQNGSI